MKNSGLFTPFTLRSTTTQTTSMQPLNAMPGGSLVIGHAAEYEAMPAPIAPHLSSVAPITHAMTNTIIIAPASSSAEATPNPEVGGKRASSPSSDSDSDTSQSSKKSKSSSSAASEDSDEDYDLNDLSEIALSSPMDHSLTNLGHIDLDLDINPFILFPEDQDAGNQDILNTAFIAEENDIIGLGLRFDDEDFS